MIINLMKRLLRIRLLTFVILAGVLPAVFGMLWRCGQINYQTHQIGQGITGCEFTIREARLFHLELRHDPGMASIELNVVDVWVSRRVWEGAFGWRIPVDSYRATNEIKAVHPWDGRDWIPFRTRNLFSISTGESMASIAPSAEAIQSAFPRSYNAAVALPGTLWDLFMKGGEYVSDHF